MSVPALIVECPLCGEVVQELYAIPVPFASVVSHEVYNTGHTCHRRRSDTATTQIGQETET